MAEKGLLSQKPKGRAFLYSAKISRAKTQTRMVRDLLGRVFDGSASALVTHLLQQAKLTPLHQATDRSCVEILIAKKADVDVKDNDGWAPLHYAARRGHEDLAEVLIGGGANVNPTNECRKPLHWAVKRGHTNIVKLLIEKGADVNAEDCYSDMPLHYAMWSKRKEAARLLLDNGANPNARDMSSFAPLHYAPNKDIAELLITKGADINLNNGWGGTALSRAKKKGHTEIVELLRRHGAKE